MPADAPSARAGRVLGAVAATTLVLAGGWLVLAITGMAGGRGGWLTAPLLLALPVAATAWASWGPHRQRQRVVTASIALAIALGVSASRSAHLTHARLWQQLDGTRLPSGLDRVDDEEFGNPLCLDTCPYVTRTFLARGTPGEWMPRFKAAFRAADFSVTSGADDEADASRGRLRARMAIDTAVITTYQGDTGRPVPRPVPAGSVAVRVTLEG